MRFRLMLIPLAAVCATLSACQPQTPAEKAENKMEDAAHETKQGMERAGDKVKDATN